MYVWWNFSVVSSRQLVFWLLFLTFNNIKVLLLPKNKNLTKEPTYSKREVFIVYQIKKPCMTSHTWFQYSYCFTTGIHISPINLPSASPVMTAAFGPPT